ncbi:MULTISPECIES: Crp/Fnr family transcriptional regulator [unclassified Streptomyces]|uniref:Crp/Fnr family transcriptional regulator n=1 Tax=unclassified Streptomyces TaxID=2593676 RepID=UPI000B854B4B|nr:MULTISPECIES: Crp/Fnr family transcriptional regulator [unclassified Streptomyces]MYS20816.1 cyclic nucleotide-binding domain-containing protein [Streptomyces sp. SID4948]
MSRGTRWKEHDLSDHCSEKDLADMEAVGHLLGRARREPFFKEHEMSDHALLIKQGHVMVVQGDPGRIIDIRGKGAIVGEAGVFSGNSRSASIIALNDVRAVYLPKGPWLEFLHAHPDILIAVSAAAYKRTERANAKRAESELPIEQQLAIELTELVDYGVGERVAEDDEDSSRVPMSQAEISSLLGERKLQSVKKAIGKLRDKGIIGTDRRLEITIRKLSALRVIADGLEQVS